MTENIEELEELKKKLEEERKKIATDREELEAEKERYVKMAIKKEERIQEKVNEMLDINKELEKTMEEEETIDRLKDILIAALKKDSKFIIGVMKESGMTKEDLKRIEAYLTGYMGGKKKSEEYRP